MSSSRAPGPSFSATWHDLFGSRDAPERTEAEVAFLERVLPLPGFRRVLDVCCGYGRHAARLVRDGYEVVGVELDPAVAAEARRRAPGARILVQDARDLDAGAPADAAIVMWASFGWFGDEEDGRLLGRLASALRPGGRLVLDVYRPGFFRARQGVRTREVAGRELVERRAVVGDRLGSSSTTAAAWRTASSGGSTSRGSSRRSRGRRASASPSPAPGWTRRAAPPTRSPACSSCSSETGV